MKRNFAAAVALVGVFAFARSGLAQGPPIPPGGVPGGVHDAPQVVKDKAKQDAEIAAFQTGFEISTDGGATWSNNTAHYTVTSCPTSTTALCGSGAPAQVKFMVRFPAITSALDQGGGLYYFVDNDRSVSVAGACNAGLHVSAPDPNMVVIAYPTAAWTAQSRPPSSDAMACRWRVTAKVYPGLTASLRPTTITSNKVDVIVASH
jgi:hypothetical protein